jgi:uncharacterized membrane protein YccC
MDPRIVAMSTSAPSKVWYERIPLGPMLLLAVAATLMASLIQELWWMGLALIVVSALWVGIIYVLIQRFGDS